jgi:hypothetical protein
MKTLLTLMMLALAGLVLFGLVQINNAEEARKKDVQARTESADAEVRAYWTRYYDALARNEERSEHARVVEILAVQAEVAQAEANARQAAQALAAQSQAYAKETQAAQENADPEKAASDAACRALFTPAPQGE